MLCSQNNTTKSFMKCYENAVVFIIAALAVHPAMALRIQNRVPPARELKPADDICKGLAKQAKGMCKAYYSGKKKDMAKILSTNTAKAALAAQYLETFGKPMPGLVPPSPLPSSSPTTSPTPLLPKLFPDTNGVLLQAAAEYINGDGAWDGYTFRVYYGYVKRCLREPHHLT
jgi:hypothetical protein